MTTISKEDEIQIFIAACKFIKGKPDFEIDEDNFPMTAARAFKVYRNFMDGYSRRKKENE
jgi:hypothetical protein